MMLESPLDWRVQACPQSDTTRLSINSEASLWNTLNNNVAIHCMTDPQEGWVNVQCGVDSRPGTHPCVTALMDLFTTSTHLRIISWLIICINRSGSTNFTQTLTDPCINFLTDISLTSMNPCATYFMDITHLWPMILRIDSSSSAKFTWTLTDPCINFLTDQSQTLMNPCVTYFVDIMQPWQTLPGGQR